MRQFFILLLALVWTWLTFTMMHDLGYEKATGYLDLSETLRWSGLTALPLWLGLLTANKRKSFPCLLRRLCAFALLGEAGFIFFKTWLVPLGLLPLLGVILLIWPELIRASIHPPERTPVEQIKFKKMQQFKWLIVAVGLGFIYWRGWLHNPLPSDKEMINHFNQHRAEFEQLVQDYRNFRNTEVFYEKSSRQAIELTKKLKISHINNGCCSWMPDAYSKKIARIRGQYYGHSAKGNVVSSNQEQIDYWRHYVPELFAGVAPIAWSHQIDRLAGEIHLISGENGRKGYKFPLGYGLIYQAYYYFPQVPIVQNGSILVPYYDVQNKPTTHPFWRVFDSLNDYPSNWKRGECVLKRIDSNWFLAMCRAA
jgi:hypothetical protein